MSEKTSSLTRFMKDKLYPGSNNARVVDITKRGNLRMVHLSDGTMDRTTKARLLKTFGDVLKKQQGRRAKASIRTTDDGHVKVTLGGRKKGKRKQYATKQNAMRAIARSYGERSP